MTESITSSSVFNSFAVFVELLTGISALSTLKASFGVDKSYFEDMPNFKASNFQSKVGFPCVMIDTDMDPKSMTIKDKRHFMYTTTVTIFTDYSVESVSNNLNGYLNAIVNWFYANKTTLRLTYGLIKLEIAKERTTEVINQKKMVLGRLMFNYHVTLDTSS